MNIELLNLSKRFGYQWIIRNLDYNFQSGTTYAISGRNGSGKSTLIKLISGYLSPSEGQVRYIDNELKIEPSDFFRYFTWVAPYTDLIEEFTMEEIFNFHNKFKPLRQNITFEDFLDQLEWKHIKDKQIRFYSSGMKQKLQLGLAILSETQILLLDEPTSYLDAQAKSWFKNFLLTYGESRIIIISSNDVFDIEICDTILELTN